MNHNSRNILLAGAFALIAVVAGFGWMRHSTTLAPAAGFATTTVPQPTLSYPATPAPSDGYYSTTPRPVYVRQGAGPTVYQGGQPTVYAERPSVVYETRPVHHGRSKEKSIAIVAGSAGVGAAIGAIAGGGKGAAIGALAGGGGGFAYDRATHNH